MKKYRHLAVVAALVATAFTGPAISQAADTHHGAKPSDEASCNAIRICKQNWGGFSSRHATGYWTTYRR